MIETLGNSHILWAELSDDKKSLVLTEACDVYFSVSLTKTQVIELANDFLLLAEKMGSGSV